MTTQEEKKSDEAFEEGCERRSKIVLETVKKSKYLPLVESLLENPKFLHKLKYDYGEPMLRLELCLGTEIFDNFSYLAVHDALYDLLTEGLPKVASFVQTYVAAPIYKQFPVYQLTLTGVKKFELLSDQLITDRCLAREVMNDLGLSYEYLKEIQAHAREIHIFQDNPVELARVRSYLHQLNWYIFEGFCELKSLDSCDRKMIADYNQTHIEL